MPSIFHKPIIELAVELQGRSKLKFDDQPNDLVRDALFVLCHDAVTVHRACGALVDAGWPAPGAALLRTVSPQARKRPPLLSDYAHAG